MHPQDLGYLGVRAKNTEDWVHGANLFRLELVDGSRARLALQRG